jgi:Uma2 family endonuclease
METQPRPRLTPEEYLEIERKAEYKSEYFNGEMFGMSGGTAAHSLIAMNVGRSIGNQLRGGPCVAFNSDLRVLANATGLYAYPDLSVVCDEPKFAGGMRDVLLNPILLVEVLSPLTEAYDRGLKFQHYRSIESLRHFLLVSSDCISVELFTRQSEGTWRLTFATELTASLTLEAINCNLLLSDVYDKIEFDAAPIHP